MSVRHLLLNQLLALRAAGFEVGAISAPGADLAPVAAAGVPHYPVPFTRRMTPLADLRAAWHLWRLFRRERFTIVHTHQVKAALFGQVAARLAGIPVVVNTIHGFYFHDRTPALKRRAWILLERLMARFSTLLLSQNREDIETAVREGICRRDQIRYIGNGIDLARFDRRAIDDGELARLRESLGVAPGDRVVGFVGRLVREKGVFELFDAIRRLQPRIPGLRLLVIGPVDRDKADAIEPDSDQARALAGAAVFTGYRHDMPALYALMDVCVLPSHREGMPRSPMEASAMGVPCVATAIRGCREVVQEGINGSLVPVGDVAALAEAIATLLDQPAAAAAAMGARARALALERFDERQVFERVAAAYRDLLGDRGLPVNCAPAAETAHA
jgi:glycosyltransferase involved in cell wall biosynthesis